MAAFLGNKTNRLERASSEGIVSRDEVGLYPCEIVTAQWLEYERELYAKGSKKSEFERQRARLARAKAEAAERKLAMLDQALVGPGDIIERAKAALEEHARSIADEVRRIMQIDFEREAIA